MTAGLRREELPELLGVPLSAEQLAAATAELAPGLIVAGAGSGKTTVMAARVVWLVGSGQVEASGVLGLTFTNKAAAELLHRIRTALRQLSPDDRSHADDAAVATYHSFAGALLREFGLLIGVEPGAELMSSVRQRQLAMQVVAGADVDHRHLGAAPSDVVSAVLALDSLLADSDVAGADLLAFDTELMAQLRSRDRQQKTGQRMLATAAARTEIGRLVAAYRAAKRERDLLDFADYVRLAAALSRRHAAVGALLRERHQAVLLDEYQDTSVAQRGMLQALFAEGHPVTAVGDPCQAIYGWRGASPHNMDGFGQHFPDASGRPAASYTLATNRRSGAHILALANDVSADLRSVHRGVAALQPDERATPGDVVVGLLPTIADELAWLTERIADRGKPWRDVAVLARTNDGAAEVVAALRSAGIPFQVHGRQALLALPEVRWLVWALRLVVDPTANDALLGVLMGPAWRIGQRDLALLARRARDLAGSTAAADEAAAQRPGDELVAALASDPLESPCLLDALHDLGDPARYPYSDPARRRFARAARMIRGWQRRSGSAVADLVREIAAESGLAAELLLGSSGGAPGSPPDDAGLQAFTDLARGFDDIGGGRGVSEFLGWLAVADSIADGPEAPGRPDAEAVTVMTVHAAKGLEFPVVAVPGLVAGSFPSDRGRGLWPTSSVALPPDLLSEPIGEEVAQFPADPSFPRAAEFTSFTAAARAAERLEEVRLAYVAMTRAKQSLILSGHRWGRTQTRPRQPSEYLSAAAAAAAEHRATLDTWALPPDEGAANPMLERATEEPAESGATAREAHLAVARAVLDPTTAGRRVALQGSDEAVAESWDRGLARVRAELARRRAAPEVPLPPDLSVSQWLAMARDPAGFGLQLLRPVPWADSRRAGLGEDFHAWVAAREDQLALWDAEDLIDPDEGVAEEQAALREAFEASPFGWRVPLAVEHEVSISVAGRLIRGRIDAVYQVDGQDWIVDWKTGAAGTADPLQLALYRIAWAADRGRDLDQIVGCFVHVRQRRYDVYRDLPGQAALAGSLTEQSPAVEPTTTHHWEV